MMASETFWTGVLGAVGALCAALGAAAGAFWKTAQGVKERDRTQWSGPFLHQISDLKNEMNVRELDHHNEVRELEGKLEAAEKERRRLESDREALRVELRFRELQLAQAGLRFGPRGSNGSTEARIIADQNGKITDTNPHVTFLFGWRSDELIGKPITMLIPERYRAAHRAGIRKVIQTRVKPDRTRVLELWGLTREGQEIPISLRIEAWDGDGTWTFGAVITRRFPVSDAEPPPPSPAPEPPPSVTISAPPGSQVDARITTDGAAEKPEEKCP